jgi:hypothetical protein
MSRTYWRNGKEVPCKPTIAVKTDKVKVRLTQNQLFALHVSAAAYLYENPSADDVDAVRSVYDALPHRDHDLKRCEYRGDDHYLASKSHKVPFTVELLPALVKLLRYTLSGGWVTDRSTLARIEEIEKIPALILLGLAAQ